MSAEDLVQKIVEALTINARTLSYADICSFTHARKAIVKYTLKLGEGDIFVRNLTGWRLIAGIQSHQVDNFISNNLSNINKKIEDSKHQKAAKKRISKGVKYFYGTKDTIVLHGQGENYDPHQVSVSARSDGFHYGKKKTYTGYIDGAYATTNVPAGGDKVVHINRNSIKSPIGGSFARKQPKAAEPTYAEFDKGLVVEAALTVYGVADLLKKIRHQGNVMGKTEIPRNFHSGQAHSLLIKPHKGGLIQATFRASKYYHNNQEISLNLKRINKSNEK